MPSNNNLLFIQLKEIIKAVQQEFPSFSFKFKGKDGKLMAYHYCNFLFNLNIYRTYVNEDDIENIKKRCRAIKHCMWWFQSSASMNESWEFHIYNELMKINTETLLYFCNFVYEAEVNIAEIKKHCDILKPWMNYVLAEMEPFFPDECADTTNDNFPRAKATSAISWEANHIDGVLTAGRGPHLPSNECMDFESALDQELAQLIELFNEGDFDTVIAAGRGSTQEKPNDFWIYWMNDPDEFTIFSNLKNDISLKHIDIENGYPINLDYDGLLKLAEVFKLYQKRQEILKDSTNSNSLQKPKRVLVHCYRGVGRTGSVNFVLKFLYKIFNQQVKTCNKNGLSLSDIIIKLISNNEVLEEEERTDLIEWMRLTIANLRKLCGSAIESDHQLYYAACHIVLLYIVITNPEISPEKINEYREILQLNSKFPITSIEEYTILCEKSYKNKMLFDLRAVFSRPADYRKEIKDKISTLLRKTLLLCEIQENNNSADQSNEKLISLVWNIADFIESLKPMAGSKDPDFWKKSSIELNLKAELVNWYSNISDYLGQAKMLERKVLAQS